MEKALLRNLITLSHNIAKEAYNANKEVSEILDNVEQSVPNFDVDEQETQSATQDETEEENLFDTTSE